MRDSRRVVLRLVVLVVIAFTACGREGNVLPTSLTSGASPSPTTPTASPEPSASVEPTESPEPLPTSDTPSPAPTASRVGRAGIHGSVRAGPTCPVEQQNSPCPERGVEGAEVTAKSTSSGEVHSTAAGKQGAFSLELPPGAYDVTASSETVMGCDTQRVDVTEGHSTPVVISCDTGIR